MKTNVQPGMLAYVVPPKNSPPITPGMIGRIVYVERPDSPNEVLKDINGRLLRNTLPSSGLAWIISAKEPMPCMVRFGDGQRDVWYMQERPMLDECLRPLLDPNLDVSDEEVKELYSTKEKECQVSQ
jgi:hypothetical protein